jgi:tol-pal system protein YbgF
LSELASRPVQAAPAKQAEAPEPAIVAAVQPNLPLPTVPVVPAPRAETPPPVDPLAESKQYEAALNQFRAANYVGAIAGFKAFGRLYPNSTLASNAQYWIGYSYYAMGDYRTALAQDEKLIIAYPQSNKVPDAWLNISRCQEELKEPAAARRTLEGLVSKYAGTNAAAIASRRLEAFR